MKCTYTKEELQKAVSLSYSVANALKQLGLKPVGGNYGTVKRKIKEHSIDISHFTGQGWNKGKVYKRYCKSIPLADVLKSGVEYPTNRLKSRLLFHKLKEVCCDSCKLTSWCDMPIKLELHHVNGDRRNNTIENLQLLCPNCHSLTPNYRGRNIKKDKTATRLKFTGKFTSNFNTVLEPTREKTRIRIIKKRVCAWCAKESPISQYKKGSRFCSMACVVAHRHRHIPTKESLLQSFDELRWFVPVGKKFGVSDNAVRKWCKIYGITKETNPSIFAYACRGGEIGRRSGLKIRRTIKSS